MNEKNLLLDPDQLNAICQLVGIRFHTGLLRPMATWLKERLSALSLPSVAAYLDWLADAAHRNAERPALSHVASSRETFFLRDHGQIEVLRQIVIPELMLKRITQKRLRLWSVGCSTGEEAYTLAILLHESGLLSPDWKLEVVGYDIDQEALMQAKNGRYRDWSFRGCPADFRQKYFRKVGDAWQISTALRQQVDFYALDLLAPSAAFCPSGLAQADIILCRNVFIYLDQAAINHALEHLTSCLAEGGYLFCAPGELAVHPRPDLAVRAFPEAVVYQKRELHPADAIIPGVQVPLGGHELQPVRSPEERSAPANLGRGVETPTASGHEASMALAWQAANRGRLEEAAALCAQVRGHHPLDPEAYYLQAILALANGDVAVARDELRRVLYLAPEYLLAYPLLAELCLASQDYSAAERYCRQGLARIAGMPPEQSVSPYATGTVAEIGAHLEQLMADLIDRD